MNATDPVTVNTNKLPLANHNKINYIYIGLGVLTVLLVLAIVIIFVSRSSNPVSETKKSNADNQEVTTTNAQNELTPLLEVGICPEKLSFSNGLSAELNGKKYLLSDASLKWAEPNCPNITKEGVGQSATDVVSSLKWSFNGSEWVSNGNVPACNTPLEITSPVEMSLVSGMLYPGQYRGNDYKPHGGFAFDNQTDNSVVVRLPDDAVLWRAVRYIEGSNIQYILDFISDCGIAYRFDHLLTLAPKLDEIINTLPEATSDTKTTLITPPIYFSKNEIIATEVGFRSPLNVSFDFGVYDLRKRNTVSLNDSAWAELHKNKAEYAYFGICWLDNLAGNDKVTARALNARGKSGDIGKESDYCEAL